MSDDRTPPKRVRLSGLQEAHLIDLLAADQACAAMYYAVGFDAAEVPARTAAELAALTRDHNVFVVEADWKAAGYAAWRDEAPGVAYVDELNVNPEVQRFGLGSMLLGAIRNDARKHHIHHIVLRAWAKAPWAVAFYRKNGFHEMGGDTLPEAVLAWVTQKTDGGRPLVRPGEILLWGEVGAAPPAPVDEEENGEIDDSPTATY
jgi:GNAT superfamily N-acetyltransferase